MQNIVIADSTLHDSQSQIRGLGRYVQALQMVFGTMPQNPEVNTSTYIHPFFNIIAQPVLIPRFFKFSRRIAVVHDVIPLKYPHLPWVGIKGTLWEAINCLLLRLYHRIVTDSESSKRDISTYLHVSPRKIVVVYPFSPLQDIVLEDIPPLLPYDLKPNRYLIYVGDVNWHKNIVTIAKAAIKANMKLVCVGGAFVKQVPKHPWHEELYEFSNLAVRNPDIIIRTGFIDDVILATLFHNALANILLSFDEGFGYSCIEAGHFCTPSILADTPIFHEISGDQGAMFVNPRDSEAVVEQIHILQEDLDRRRALGTQAYEQSKRYSKEAFRRQWIDILGL